MQCNTLHSERPAILLATAQAFIISPEGNSQKIRLLIDRGSELTLISSEVVQAVNLSIIPSTIPILGIGSVTSGHTKGCVSFVLRAIHSTSSAEVTAHILPKITAQLPTVSLSNQEWDHIKDLELADPDFLKSGRIDILLGADLYGKIIKPGLKSGGCLDPIAICTILGWTILGPVKNHPSASSLQTYHVITNQQLHESLSKFWELEEIPHSVDESLTMEEAECENHFKSTHSRDSAGRYIVRLPFKSSAQQLGTSKHTAQRCLNRLIKRLDQNPNLKVQYSDFLAEYASLGHMQQVSSSAPEPVQTYYLPHHCVVREDSETTKLRVVFNGSSKSSLGTSLNDTLHIGPKLQANIFDVLLYVRRHKFIFTTDITKMFRQILIHPDDWDYQRILWSDEHQNLITYNLTTVTYGTRSAPYLAGRVLQQLLIDEGDKFPLAIDSFRKGSYVDDISGGADNLENLNTIASQVEALCLSGCFPLAKWKSNHPDFSKSSKPLSSEDTHSFVDSTSKILGLSWNCQDDIFKFTGNTIQHSVITKRSITSEAAQLFDPLGLISPVIVNAKIIIQHLWLEKVGWDDPLTPEFSHKWKTFRNHLPQLAHLTIPRWINLTSDKSNVEIHGFSDASQSAMAAVVYIRVKHHCSTSFSVNLLCSKTRVAPLKRLTIPRLELSAALLLTKLVKHVQESLELTEAPVYLWTDSSVTFSWIQGEPCRWKEFVKNRVQSIQEILPAAVWKFISGKENPADCASRGLSPTQLINHSLWWLGPQWLSQPSHQHPIFTAQDDEDVDMEVKPIKTFIVIKKPNLPLNSMIDRYSSLTKLIRVTATLLRAVSIFKGVPDSQLSTSPLNPSDLQSALMYWVHVTQQAYFPSEIHQLSQGKPLRQAHPLSRLTAYLDQSQILRVGGRLQNSKLDQDSKHPPILPKDCQLAKLIISDAHAKTMHGGTQLTLSSIRKRCWIIGGRAPIKAYIHRCITCSRIRGIRAQQLMGQLPSSRVTPSLVFENTGVDYAGPISLKFFQGRGTRCYKGWIAVFVCLSTSALHLEVVTDYSSEGFLKAFRRFTARRGICKTLRSDCGTNFKGADLMLKQLFQGVTKKSAQIQQLMANDGTKWIFNPPAAPHMGGKWEAAVKSVKFHLQRTIADTLFTYEDFSTFLTQVEAVLNSRPLSSLSDDPEDISALTPGHFIRGGAINTIPEPSLTSTQTSRLSQFQLIQERFQNFWERWSSECLQSHQSRSKWTTTHNNMKVGSLVLLADERYPPSKWPLARVQQLHPGKDGLTRVVSVKTVYSTLTRPLSKLIPLPGIDEAEVFQ